MFVAYAHRHANANPIQHTMPQSTFFLNKPLTITRTCHNIRHEQISKNARYALQNLHKAGYLAYLVGGSVRDLLLERVLKDFDIATNARPEQVRRLFKNSRLIGKRFRLAHIFFETEILEVATFRKAHLGLDYAQTLQSKNMLYESTYGNLEDDARQRDFSVNALYYDPVSETIMDFAGGVDDLKKRVIRILGDPSARYKEDPVRILRALRFAAKLQFTIEKNTARAILNAKALLSLVPRMRLFSEITKLFYCGHSVSAFKLMRSYQIFKMIFPVTEAYLFAKQKYGLDFILKSFAQTDERIQKGLGVNPGFLFATLLWPAILACKDRCLRQGAKPKIAMDTGISTVLSKQLKTCMIPKRCTQFMREILLLQDILERGFNKKHRDRIAMHARFRAAYDFLLLRAQEDPQSLMPALDKWQPFYQKK